MKRNDDSTLKPLKALTSIRSRQAQVELLLATQEIIKLSGRIDRLGSQILPAEDAISNIVADRWNQWRRNERARLNEVLAILRATQESLSRTAGYEAARKSAVSALLKREQAAARKIKSTRIQNDLTLRLALDSSNSRE